jgi:hypothetical protein
MRVPTYNAPTVTENAAPAPMQNPNVPNGMAAIGQGLSNAASVFDQMAEDADNLRALDADNKAAERMLDLTYGQAGLLNVKGRDILTPTKSGKPLSDDYLERARQVGTELEAGMNERQKLKFRQRFDQRLHGFRETAMRHETREMTEYAKTVTNASVALETESAVKNWSDPTAVASGVQNITEALQAQGVREGIPADAIKVIIADKVSTLHAGVIASAVDGGSLDYARTYLEENKDALTTEARLRAIKVLDEGDFEVRTQTGAENSMAEAGGDAAKALEIARKKFKGKEEDAVVQRIKAFDSERVALREREQKTAADEGWKLASQGRAPTPSMYAAMDGRDAAAIRKHLVEGTPTKTNITKWLEFTNLPPATIAAMSPTDLLREYGPHFADADIRNANEMMRAAKGLEGGKASQEGLQLMTTADLVKRSAREIGILPEKGQPSAGQEASFDDFRNAMQTKVNAWEAANGKKATPEVLQEMLRDEKLNKVKLDQWGSDPERAVVTLTPDEMGKAYVEVGGQQIKLASIPKDYRQSAILRIQARGLTVTESLIAQMWAADQFKK